MEDRGNINYNYLRIGETYTRCCKNYVLAKTYIDSAITGVNSTKNLGKLKDAYESFYKIDSTTADYKAEAQDYKKYIFYRDSINNQTGSQNTVKIEMGYEFDQIQTKEKAEQAQKDANAESDRK